MYKEQLKLMEKHRVERSHTHTQWTRQRRTYARNTKMIIECDLRPRIQWNMYSLVQPYLYFNKYINFTCG